MRTVRHLIRRNQWTPAALLVLLTLWISAGQMQLWTSADHACDAATQAGSSGTDQSDEQKAPTVQAAYEVVVTPAAKVQLTFFFSLVQELAFTEIVIERVAPNVPLPQSDYLRTLFRLIISPNAP